MSQRFNKLKCWLTHHNFEFTEWVSDVSARHRCKRCGLEIATNYLEGMSIEWTKESETFFARLKANQDKSREEAAKIPSGLLTDEQLAFNIKFHTQWGRDEQILVALKELQQRRGVEKENESKLKWGVDYNAWVFPEFGMYATQQARPRSVVNGRSDWIPVMINTIANS